MTRSRPARRPASASSRAKQHRALRLESLEDRRLLASDVITGLGVIGETYSDEFSQAEMAAGILNWVALIDRRGADVGGDGNTVHGVPEPPDATNYDPRGTGYAYNWSLDRATQVDILLEAALAKLGGQVSENLVSHAVIMFGMHEFTDLPGLAERRFPPGELYFAWYNDLYNQNPNFDIQSEKTPLLSTMSIAVENLSRSGANVVLATIPDPSDLPRFVASHPDAAGRNRVTAAVQTVNEDIRALGQQLRVPVVDIYQLQKDLLGTQNGAAGRLANRSIGGVSFNTSVGAVGTHLFKDDIHPGTAMQALIANSVMSALNRGYGTNLQLYSEQEILAQVGRGGAFTGNTLNLNYNNYVRTPSDLLVVLDFGATGDSQNDFAARMGQLWSIIAQNDSPLSANEIAQLKADIKAQLDMAFGAPSIGANNLRIVDYADLPDNVSLDGANFHRINFGLTSTPAAGRNAVIGNFDQDWRNTDLNGVGFIAPEELGGVLTNLTGMTRAAKIQYVRNALSFYTVQGIGLSLGLSHTDAYARPQITPANYADTAGAQNVDFMSGNENFGFSIDAFKNNIAFSFSPLAKAKLQMAIGVVNNRLTVGLESEAAHGATGSAQQLTLQTVAGSGVKVAGVGRANIAAAGQKDVYRFEATAGQLITLQTLLAGDAPASLNTVIRLLDANGVELAVSDDTRLGFNSIGQSGGVLQSTSSLVLNFPAPATGAYYVEVSGSGSTTGQYDLLVATMPANATASPWTNPIDPLNVDNEPGIVPLDALIVINELNNRQFSDPDGRLRPPPAGSPPPYYDVDGDGFVIALDALIIINYLNAAQSQAGGEGEADDSVVADDAMSLLLNSAVESSAAAADSNLVGATEATPGTPQSASGTGSLDDWFQILADDTAEEDDSDRDEPTAIFEPSL